MELGSQIAVPMPDWTIPWALLPAIPIPSMSAIYACMPWRLS